MSVLSGIGCTMKVRCCAAVAATITMTAIRSTGKVGGLTADAVAGTKKRYCLQLLQQRLPCGGNLNGAGGRSYNRIHVKNNKRECAVRRGDQKKQDGGRVVCGCSSATRGCNPKIRRGDQKNYGGN